MTVPALNNISRSGAVLIVEDADTCASMLEILFGSMGGLEILTATSAERAWDLLARRGPDVRVLVTDLHLPGMDGFELIERVRADHRHARLPIVVITGSTDPTVSDRLRRHSVSAIFAKPYSPAVVREKMEQLLGNEMQLD